MANPISDFMANWLNTTYKYLKESGGGPTYPPKPVTVGPGVFPTGPYSLLEDVSNYPTGPYTLLDPAPLPLPLPFNPGATGLDGAASSERDAVEEIAKENPPPPVVSGNFLTLYGGMMNACIADQTHRHNNPNARSACQNFAETGNISDMILMPDQKKALGLTPPPEEDAKPSEVRLAEDEASLTGQIKTGVREGLEAWRRFQLPDAPLKGDPSGNNTLAGDPAGNNFQTLNDRLRAFFPEIPEIPNLNSPVLLFAGIGLLVILLIAIVK